MERRALGRGLDLLLPEGTVGAPVEAGAVVRVPMSRIIPNRYQPREMFDAAALHALAGSIQRDGVVSPVLVRRRGEQFELIAGERRWRAAQQAGLTAIPALVRDVDDAGALRLSLLENLQRTDLNPIEQAKACQRLMDEFGLTQEAIGTELGRDRASVANLVRLLRLPPAVQAAVGAGQLSMGHARALLGVTDPLGQARLAEQIVHGGWSVREAERAVARWSRGGGRRRPVRGRDPDVAAVEGELQHLLGARVRIVGGGRRGRVEVPYSSPEEFERLLHVLRRVSAGPG